MLDVKPASTPLAPGNKRGGPTPLPPRVSKVVTPAQTSTLPFKLAAPLVLGLEKAFVAASGGKKLAENPYLAGNFAPVSDERYDAELEVVEGQLPAALNGAFLRNGPNPFLTPNGNYHWFDGGACALKALAPAATEVC